MRTLILAGFMTALLGAAASGQEQANTQESMMAPSLSAGLGGTMDDAIATNRVYTLPPEVDVEVTGSIGSRHCVGDTVGQRLCQDTVEAETAR